MNILLTGCGSFIGSAIAAEAGDSIMAIRHDGSPPDVAFDVIIHAGRDTLLGKPAYRLSDDVEWRWAEFASKRGSRLVHLGSRKVYAPDTKPLRESSPTGPTDIYGRQKLAMEGALRSKLGGNFLCLRIANVFGFELGRRSFFGAMMSGLCDNRAIHFDMNPKVARDFVPVAFVAQAILALTRSGATGVINVGSGCGIQTGAVAHALIDGYGTGELIVDNHRMHDEFTLDVAKMNELTGLSITGPEILAQIRVLGTKLHQG